MNPHSAGRYSLRAQGGQGAQWGRWVQPNPVGRESISPLPPPTFTRPLSSGETPNTHRVSFGSWGTLNARQPLVSFLPHLSWWSNEPNQSSVALGAKGSVRQRLPQDQGGSGTSPGKGPQLLHDRHLVSPYLPCGRGLP